MLDDVSLGSLADMRASDYDVRFSNRPVGVKQFQVIRHCSVDVTHGLALLYGIGTKALPPWDSRTRRNNLFLGLTVKVMAGPSGHANSPHPSSREGHLSTAGWSSSFLLLFENGGFLAHRNHQGVESDTRQKVQKGKEGLSDAQ